jgi:hypothetical protein
VFGGTLLSSASQKQLPKLSYGPTSSPNNLHLKVRESVFWGLRRAKNKKHRDRRVYSNPKTSQICLFFITRMFRKIEIIDREVFLRNSSQPCFIMQMVKTLGVQKSTKRYRTGY